jgi:Spore Coat Protein U domain
MKKHQMKKLAILAAAVGAMGLGAGASEAANTSGTFNVNITLTSACTITSAVTPVVFAYTSLQGGAQASTGGDFSVSCTNSLPYHFGLQTGNGVAVPPGAATINVTDDSGINLNYTLTAPAGGPLGAGGTGNGAPQNYTVTGSMLAGQSGVCAVGSCTNAAATNNVQTLIVNY